MKYFITYIVFLYCLTVILRCNASSNDIIERLSDPKIYNKRIMPMENGQAVNVSMQVFVESLGPVNDRTNTFEISFYFRKWWKDYRLKYNETFGDTTLAGSSEDLIWAPDIKLMNSKSFETNAERIVFSPNGMVHTSQRVKSLVSCHLDFKRYPFDTQRCFLQFMSYSFANNELHLKWHETGLPKHNLDTIRLAGYVLTDIKQRLEKYLYIIGGKEQFWNSLEFDLIMKRSITYHVFQVFAPTVLLMVLNFASYWIPYKAVPARVTLIVTTFLTCSLILQAATEKTVRLSYVTPMQLFLIINILFIVLSVIEYIIVMLFKNKLKKNKGKKPPQVIGNENVQYKEAEFFTVNEVHMKFQPALKLPSLKQDVEKDELNDHQKEIKAAEDATKNNPDDKKEESKTHHIDRICGAVIPILYVIFIIAYWTYYETTWEVK